MRLGRALTLTAAGLLTASCTYHNTIYNAERLYERAERSRRAGEDSLAHALYREVIEKTGTAYRARPDTDWSADALFLLGRSRLRIGEVGAADAALAEAEPKSEPDMRPSIRVYRAAALADAGRYEEALSLAEGSLDGELDPVATAEARLVAGRAYLARGYAERGWWELDRAIEADGGVRVEAGITRLHWAVADADSIRTRRALELLFSYPEGGARLDDVRALVARASERWGPDLAARLSDGAETATWDREARGRTRLMRARLLRAARRGQEAEAEAWEVARSLGAAAAEARIQLASWALAMSEDIVDAYESRSLLLPAESDPGAAELLDGIDELERYTDIGLEEPLGWFAAGEVARDRLGASYVARGLFLAYADAAPDEPWAPKALLAALEVSPNPDDREWLVGRLEAHARSPYVLAAYGGSDAGFEALEEELQVRLRGLAGR